MHAGPTFQTCNPFFKLASALNRFDFYDNILLMLENMHMHISGPRVHEFKTSNLINLISISYEIGLGPMDVLESNRKTRKTLNYKVNL